MIGEKKKMKIVRWSRWEMVRAKQWRSGGFLDVHDTLTGVSQHHAAATTYAATAVVGAAITTRIRPDLRYPHPL